MQYETEKTAHHRNKTIVCEINVTLNQLCSNYSYHVEVHDTLVLRPACWVIHQWARGCGGLLGGLYGVSPATLRQSPIHNSLWTASQDQVADGDRYVQTISGRKCLCLDHLRWKKLMSRHSCVHVKIFVHF